MMICNLQVEMGTLEVVNLVKNSHSLNVIIKATVSWMQELVEQFPYIEHVFRVASKGANAGH